MGSVTMEASMHKDKFASLIEDLKSVNNHNFDLLEVNVDLKENVVLHKHLNPLNDLDNYDSDAEAVSERVEGFFFKDSYFEDREVENLVLEFDSPQIRNDCFCEQCQSEGSDPIQEFHEDSSQSGTRMIRLV